MANDRKDIYLAAGVPVRVGILMDMPDRIREGALKTYEFVVKQAARDPRFERGIELVEALVEGAPSGRISNIYEGWNKLKDEGCLVIIGPNHSDHNKALTEHVDNGRVPTIALGATAEHMSDYLFSVQWGSIPEDAYLIANWLAVNYHRRVTVTWDTAWHSGEYLYHFRHAAKRLGIKILTDERLSQLDGDKFYEHAKVTVAEHRALNPEAIVHFATSQSGRTWSKAVYEAQWDIPRIMNGGFFGATDPQHAEILDGWVGTGLWDEDNDILKNFLIQYEAEMGEAFPAPPELGAIYYDGMRTAIEGIALAPILTPDGVKKGLEDVTSLPSAMGGPRTVISFGPWDRRGLKGMDVMILRRLVNGKLEMEGRFDPKVEIKRTAL